VKFFRNKQDANYEKKKNKISPHGNLPATMHVGKQLQFGHNKQTIILVIYGFQN